MDNQVLDLGVARSLSAEAFGEPGSRTFRILVEAGEGQISLWLEKEQLALIGPAIDEVLEAVPAHYGHEPAMSDTETFVGSMEVRVGAVAVGYDHDRLGFSLEATDFVSPFDLDGISCLSRRVHFQTLADQIREIVAAGRPRCPLCGRPIGAGGHFCPPSNGHAHPPSSQ